MEVKAVSSCANIKVEILNYNGPSSYPWWVDSEPGEGHKMYNNFRKD